MQQNQQFYRFYDLRIREKYLELVFHCIIEEEDADISLCNI